MFEKFSTRNNKWWLVAAAVAFSALAGGGAALAQSQPQRPLANAVRQACSADFRTLCSGVQPGGGRIKACMAKNRSKLSDGCKQAVAQARAALQAKQ